MNSIKKANSPLAALLKTNIGGSFLKEGELVEGILLEKAQRAAYFDLGAIGTGIVYGAEFSHASSILKNLNVGCLGLGHRLRRFFWTATVKR